MKKFPFSKMDFETDKEKITQLAKNQGFMDFKILDAKAEIKPLSDKTKGYFVTITVEEGEQYTYAGMDIRGNKKIAKPELMEYLTMDPGDIYNDTLFTNFVRNSYIEYQSNGFFYAKLTPIDTVDKEKRSIFYTLDIFEGDKVHVENMYIIGNTKTATHVADREIRIKEGEIYDLSKLLRSRERLMKSQIFSNAIFEPRTGSEEGLIDIFWKLEEAKTGMLTIGGGYGTLSGFTLFGQISELNLFGLGYNTSLRFDYGQTRKSISTTFGSGWIGYLPISYKFSVSYSWEQIALIPKYDRFSDSSGTPGHDGIWDKIDDTGTPIQEGDPGFDSIIDQDRDGDGNTIDDPADAYDADRFVRKKTIGFGVGAGYSFSEYWSTGANQSVTLSKYYDPKNIDVNNLYEDDEYRLKSLLQDGDYALTTRTGFGITYDSSDNYLTPTKGLVFAPGVTFYGLAGGYSQFTQLTMDISGYVSLIKLKRANWNLVWANHLGLTTIGALPGKSDPQLFSEYRLSFDGMRELRGWEELVYEENLKGLGKVSFGSELRIPIPGTQNLLWWAFFFDAGNVSQDPYTLPSKFSEYRFSEGFGLKIEIPMFPIRLYFAKRLMWDDKWFKEVSDWTFVLSIAGFF
ncbi:MAG: outer membrane protein assembly factor BamA [Spirochaetae bacterium HGW-Spirochaetae-6]|nr:MAG: outer membrane protein assembly factor BamA [Spirochaetae bacterium HGW-Spirochaetae-6]